MELASKYNPADVEGSVLNPTDVNLTPLSFLPLT